MKPVSDTPPSRIALAGEAASVAAAAPTNARRVMKRFYQPQRRGNAALPAPAAGEGADRAKCPEMGMGLFLQISFSVGKWFGPMEMRYNTTPSCSTRFWLGADALEDLFDCAVAAFAEE